MPLGIGRFVSVRDPKSIGVDVSQRFARSLLHHVQCNSPGRPTGIQPQPSRSHTVHAVGRHHDRGTKPSAVAGSQCDLLFISRRIHHIDSGDERRAGLDGQRHQQRIEVDPTNEQGCMLIRLDDARRFVRTFEPKAADRVSRDSGQCMLQIGKPAQCPRADAAAAGLVSRKAQPVEQRDRDSPLRKRTRSSCPGGASPHHDDGSVGLS